jgi:predicted dehydrogenase
MSEPIRIALIGAGLYTHEAHIPALVALQDQFHVVAIASRTLETAQARAKEFPYAVEPTNDIPALLRREDIEAVNVILPVQVQPASLELALQSGKHVVSEKPIARSTAEGKRLMEQHTSGSVWMVAENFRYQASFVKAAELVAGGAIGKPVLANWTMYIALNPGDKYYETFWRRAGDFPGGFLLDGGVHWASVFRMVIGEVARASAFAMLSRPDCPPLNTIAANFEFENGCIGTFSGIYGAPRGGDYNAGLTVSGTEGFLHATYDRVTVSRGDESRTIKTAGVSNVQAELAAFAETIRHGTPNRNSPQQALQDVALIEALLRSAETGRAEMVERFV